MRLKGVTTLFILTAASIAFPIKVHHALVIFLVALCLVVFRNVRAQMGVPKLPAALLLTHLFIILLGLSHSGNLSQGYQEAERFFYSLLVMLIVYTRGRETSRTQLLSAFAVGCFILTTYGFANAAFTLSSGSFSNMLATGHKSFTARIAIQPLYLSVYFIFIFFFLAEQYRIGYENLPRWKKVMLVGGGFLAGVMVVYLRSKTGLLVFPACMIIYLVLILKKRGWWVAFLLLIVAVSTALLSGGKISVLDNYGKTVSSAFDERLLIWKGALEGIRTAPFFGAGTGGAQELLNEGYRKIGYEEGIAKEFNAHNQYLQFLARNGLAELVCFLSLLGYAFFKSSKEANYTFLLFTILVSLVMITESFLSVQKGIAFFYFLLMAFICLPAEGKER
jgi:O-antigen ligase